MTLNLKTLHCATLNFTEALVRRSVWAYWKRSVGITWPLLLVLMTAYVVFVVREGNTGWLVGVYGTVVALGYAYLTLVYVVLLRHHLATFRAMGSPQASLAIDETGFTLTSEAATSTLPWKRIQQIVRFQDFWLVYFAPNQYFTLPHNDLPEAMRHEFLERVRESGGKVV